MPATPHDPLTELIECPLNDVIADVTPAQQYELKTGGVMVAMGGATVAVGAMVAMGSVGDRSTVTLSRVPTPPMKRSQKIDVPQVSDVCEVLEPQALALLHVELSSHTPHVVPSSSEVCFSSVPLQL